MDATNLPSVPITPPSSSNASLVHPQVDAQRLSVTRIPLWRLSSLDNILEYREAQAEQRSLSARSSRALPTDAQIQSSAPGFVDDNANEDSATYAGEKGAGQENRRRFRHITVEVGFCFSMAVTQLLAEYLITGFSEVLTTLTWQYRTSNVPPFWPASILSIILSSTILVFARLSDLWGGYPVFMAGVAWLAIWTLVAGFANSITLLCVCRAMQGLAIAAYTPSSFTLFGSIYPNGARKNLALGIYAASAPLGFFIGILVSATLQPTRVAWYFWGPSALAGLTLIVSYLSIPSDRHDRPSMDLKMDWAGAFTITAGLTMVAYALAAGANSYNSREWATPAILAPFCTGILCLLLAIYIEVHTKAYTDYSNRLQSFYGTHGLRLAAWFTPMAAGGLIISVVGGTILHIFPVTILLLISGLAWIAAPLLLALSNVDAGYWPFPFPAMLCGTLGIDLTFLISITFLSAVQPVRYQGLAGAVSSVLVNLGIAFSQAFSAIVSQKAFVQVSGGNHNSVSERLARSTKAQFWFAVGSAGVGFIVCVLFVRISRTVVDEGTRAEGEA